MVYPIDLALLIAFLVNLPDIPSIAFSFEIFPKAPILYNCFCKPSILASYLGSLASFLDLNYTLASLNKLAPALSKDNPKLLINPPI